MDLELTGKVAIVTGGASGIGAAVCRMLAEEGVKVIVADRLDEKETVTALEIQQRGGTALFVQTDVSRRAQVNALVAKTLQTYGQIDILCNIAGPGAQGGQLDTTEAELDRQLNGHLKGVFNCTQEVLPHMMQRRSGKIITMGSFAAYGATEGIPAYCAAFGAFSPTASRWRASLPPTTSMSIRFRRAILPHP
jgi:NAD(P)-dependent dehydrogenase (short-subunit alcohol dehydrogenase family)